MYQPKFCPIAQQLKGLVINQFLTRPEVIEILRKIASKNNCRLDTEIFSGGEEAFASGALEIVTVFVEQITLRELLALSYDDLLTFCRGRMFFAKNAARDARDPYTFGVVDEVYTDVRIGSGSKFRKEDDHTPEEQSLSREVAIEVSRMPELRERAPDHSPDPILPEGWGGDNDDASGPPARHADPRRASLNEDYLISKIDGTLHENTDGGYERAVDVLGTEVANMYWDLEARTLYPQRHSGRKAMTSTERSRLRRWRLQIQSATTRLYK